MNRLRLASLAIAAFALCCCSTVFNSSAHAQDTTAVKEIDPSKPTNLYAQVNVGLDFQNRKTADVWGPRLNFQQTFGPDRLALLEVPFLYNTETTNFGIADMRFRYYQIQKRNLTKQFIALGGFVDISAPTGKYDNGFGASSWSVGVGVITGFAFSRQFSLFPGVSYIHLTEPTTDAIPEDLKSTSDGIGLQMNASVKFNPTTFVFINPIPSFLNTEGHWDATWLAEFGLNKILVPNRFKVNVNYNPNFTNGVYVVKVGTTFFL